MSRPYRPSNGSEGMDFMARWCERCTKDNPSANIYCPIIADTFAYPVDDPKYPKEWIQDEPFGNERCTAFEPVNDQS